MKHTTRPAPRRGSRDRQLKRFAPFLAAVVGLSFALVANPRAHGQPAPFVPLAPLAPRADVLANIQVSHTGTVKGASRAITDFSEVMLSIDPTDPIHLLGASKFFYDPARYGFHVGTFESKDGGQTWEQEQPGGIERYSLTSDPVTAFDELGNGYFTILTRGPVGLDMLRKSAGASDWELPVTVDRTTTTDKQWIVADQNPQEKSPHKGNVYMSWTNAQQTAQIMFARSTDRNASWSAPVRIATGQVQGSVPAVGPDGTVYVLYGRNIFNGPVRSTIEVAVSNDGGATFATPVTVAHGVAIPYVLPNSTFRAPASLPAFAASPTTGHLFAVWSDYATGDADILLARSADRGATWGTPVRLNDDPIRNGIDQFQPQVSVGSNGRVAVDWHDRRLDCPNEPWIAAGRVGLNNVCLDTFLTRSFDDGVTWQPNIRASAQTWDPAVHVPIDGGGNGFIGDYIGLAAGPVSDFAMWPSTANLGENPGNAQQIFVAEVPDDLVVPTATPGPSPTSRPTITRVPPPTATSTRTLTPTGTRPTPTRPGPTGTAGPVGGVWLPWVGRGALD